MKFALIIALSALATSCNNPGADSKNAIAQDSVLYKNLKIGINKENYEKHLHSNKDTIGGTVFKIFSAFTPEDSLAGLILIGPNHFAADIETKVTTDIDALKRAFTEKYGEPTTSNAKASILNVSNSKDYIQYEWELPNKMTQIGITSNDGTYNAYMKIYNFKMLEKAFRKVEENKEEQAKKDSEKF